MKFFRIGTVAISAVALGSIATADPKVAPPQAEAAGYRSLIFSDDFTQIDISKNGAGAHRWYAGLWYKRTPPLSNISQMKDFIRLTTLEGNKRGLGVEIHTLARAQSGTSTLFRFGYFEARIRASRDPMNWGAFWLESASHSLDKTEGPWPRYCEIDIVEFGIRPDGYAGSAHDWIKKKSHQTPSYPFISLPSSADISEWNTYGLLWQPGKLSFFFNDKLVRTIVSPPPCDKQDLFLILNAAKNGGEAHQSLDIDWVRVFR